MPGTLALIAPINWPATARIGGRLCGILQNRQQQALIAREERAVAGHGEGHVHGGIGVQRVFRLQSGRLHLVRRRAFLRHEHAADKRAVADGQERLGHGVEQIARSRQADRPRSAPRPSAAAGRTTASARTASDTRRSMPPITRSIQVFLAPAPRWPNSREHISGVSVSDTMPLAKMETMMVIENSRKMRPTSPVMNTSGMNTAASEMVMARIVKLISPRRIQRGLERALARLHQPHRVLQKDDGVVHQEADRQRQRHQREIVQAVAEHVHRPRRSAAARAAAPPPGISVSVARPRNRKMTSTTSQRRCTASPARP